MQTPVMTWRSQSQCGFATDKVSRLYSRTLMRSSILIRESGKSLASLSYYNRKLACRMRMLSMLISVWKTFPCFFGALAFEETEVSDSKGDFLRGSSRLLGHSTFESHGWRFTISECPDKGEMGITHSGSISRSDGGPFSVPKLKDVLDGLTYFLSFLAGVYRIPSVVIGYSSARSHPWGRIARFKQNKYRGGNWFNPQSRDAMAKLFPGFWRCFLDNPRELRGVIGSYAESSIIADAGLPKNALNESQTALEGLSRWILGRKKPRGQPVSKYIKEALDCAGISYDLHEHPSLLKMWQETYKEQQDEDDGPTLITRLRNRSIHADIVQGAFSDLYSAWELSQRYVELMLLWLFDYHQEYFDRTTGKLHLVPFHARHQFPPPKTERGLGAYTEPAKCVRVECTRR